MAKVPLNDAKLRSLPPPAKGQQSYWDKNLAGFGVRVSQGGSMTFVVKRDNNLITLGRFGVLTLAEARTAAKRLMAERTLGKVRPQSISFKSARDLFIAEKRRSRRPNTVANLEDRLDRHFHFTCQLAEVVHTEIARQLSRIDTNSEHDHALSVAKTFFNWCIDRRYIDDNPCRGISPRGHKSRARVLSDDELRAVWHTCDSVGGTYTKPTAATPNRSVVGPIPAPFAKISQLLILTGMRRGECAALHTSWIDLENKTICLPSNICKNGREHLFPIGGLAQHLLRTACSTSDDQLLFPARGRLQSPFNGWSKSKRQLDELSGVQNWTLHDLRRTYRSNLGRLGVSPHIAERLVNHISSRTDMELVYDRYTYMPEMREAVERYESWLANLIADA